MTTNPADIILWRTLAIFLLVGAHVGVSVGLLLIFKPQLLDTLNRSANRWISTRHFNRWLDQSVSIECWFYRHHRMAGIAIMLGAAYTFIFFAFLFDRNGMLRHLRSMLTESLLQGLIDAMMVFALLGSFTSFLLGFVICIRPSLLRGFEQLANQWISVRRATKMFDIPRDHVDVFVVRHAQRVGWLILLGSFYLLFILFRSLA